jgi:hypothetical protein
MQGMPWILRRSFFLNGARNDRTLTELRRPEPGDLNFWVSGDTFPDFSQLLCDLVFVVSEVRVWAERNSIADTDPIVDSPEAFLDHYRWAHQHFFKKRLRRTLKADPSRSYQPQRQDGSLIDVLPHLISLGFNQDELRSSLKKGFASKPFILNEAEADSLSQHISERADFRLTGEALSAIRQRNPELQSLRRDERPGRGKVSRPREA